MKAAPVLPLTRARIAADELGELVGSGLEDATPETRALAVQALGIVLELQALLAQSTAHTTTKE